MGRFGPDRRWARLARALAGAGVVVVRPDHPGHGDSGAVDPRREGEALGDLVAWFRQRAGDLDLLVLGSCGGAAPAASLAAVEPRVTGLALVVPFLRKRAFRRGNLARAWRLLRRTMGLPSLAVDPAVREAVATAAVRVPVWVLVGAEDRSFGDVRALSRSLSARGLRLDLEVVPGRELHTSEPENNRDARARVVRWVTRTVEGVAVAR
jgi:dienelactone hydrolase